MTLKSIIKNNRGFSLTEFLIVVGILAVIAVIAIPITVGIINSSNKQNDEVLASTYSEYMQKFATEQVGSIGFYPTLKDDSVGSDYDVLKNSSGKGSFPGITQLDSRINELSEDEVWNLIRKEACIAISAYSGEELADPYNYFIEKPQDSKMAFVYYYLTGTVALESYEKMEDSKVSIEDVNDGVVDTEDYWVYLDRKGGSGKAVGNGSDSQVRDFYVKVVQFGTGLPVNGATVTIKPYGSSTGSERSATTSSTGILVFRDVYPEIETHATKLGALEWWSTRDYSEYKHTTNLTTEPNVGTLSNPFIITLKMGTLGTLEFFEQYKTYNYQAGSTNSFNTTCEKINWYNDFITNFTKTETSIMGRDEVYESSTPEYNPLELMGEDKTNTFRFLIYGDYNMKITNQTINPATGNSYFAEYNEGITSDVWGIYNTANPGEYPSASNKYAYPVVLKRTDTRIEGKIAAENKSQPLHGTKTGLFTGQVNGVTSTENLTIETYIYAVNKNNRSEYYVSNLLSNPSEQDGTYVYDFAIHLKGQYEGTKDFEIFVCTVYGKEDKTSVTGKTVERMNVAAFPATVKADGSIYVLKTSASDFVKVNLESDVEVSNSVKIKVYEKYNGGTRYLNCNATIIRKGYPSNTTNPYAKYTGNVDENISGNYITLNGVKQGFYTLKIDLHEVHEGDYPLLDEVEFDVFIDDDEEIVIELTPVLMSYSIICKPVTAAGVAITPDINLLSADSSRGWEKIAVTVKINGYDISNVTTINVDTTTRDNNEAIISFNYGKTIKTLEITQFVECFDSSDKFTSSGNIGKNTTSYNNEFVIHRLENEANSNSDHVGGVNWDWMKNSTQHYQECYRCKYDRLFANHFVEKATNGTTTSNKYAIYNKTGAHTSDNNSTTTQHYKHCTVCNIYDEAHNCSGGSWTWQYNAYVNGTQHGCVSTSYALVANTGTAGYSNTYHYKYCDTCHGRYSVAQHNLGTVEKAATCIENGRNDCDSKCGYGVDIEKTGHNDVSTWKYINSMGVCCQKITNTSCTWCGRVSASNEATNIYSHIHDAWDSSKTAYNDPCGGLFFRTTHHMVDARHGTTSRDSCHTWYHSYWKNQGYITYETDSSGKKINYTLVNDDFVAPTGTTRVTILGLGAEEAAKISVINEYACRDGEWGYVKSGYSLNKCNNSKNYSDDRTDGVNNDVIYRYVKRSGGGWQYHGPTNDIFKGDSMLFYHGSDGKTKGLPIQNTGGWSGLMNQSGYGTAKSGWGTHICKIGICCNSFSWPTDATNPSNFDKELVYTSGDTKYGKWVYCFGTTAYERYP